jgi:hypothetical protein
MKSEDSGLISTSKQVIDTSRRSFRIFLWQDSTIYTEKLKN